MPRATNPLHGLRVMVVEDEALIVEELRERLSRAGMIFAGTADSAQSAVETALQSRPDVVLMDIRLKGDRDGIQAAADIRRHMDVPVVYLTAHSDRATLDRAKDTAPFGYVLKPFREGELLVAIEMAVLRHSLERQIRESERKYVATLASIGDAVIATDLQGRITYMNAVAEALTGWPIAEARALSSDDVFRVAHDARGALPFGPIRMALQERKTVRSDREGMFLFSRGKEAIPIDDCAAPIVDDHGRVTGVVVAFRDIRDRRLAEDALRRAQEELFQAQKMESVGRLAAGIAHDFNNLLTVVNGCTELALQDQTLSPTMRDLLGEILGAGKRAASLTSQFLGFAGKQMLQPRVVDLSAVSAGLASMLGRLIGEDIQLTVTPSPSPAYVLADPAQLEQIVMNLATNARDAMPDGGTLTIATSKTAIDAAPPDTEARVPPGRYALLAVTDTGSGIEETIKDQIFEPYFTTKGMGGGLGLATVHGIVKQSGGFIGVDSERGRGTTFKVYLPLVEDVVQTDGQPEVSPVTVRGKETILIVEDDDSVRSLLGAELRKEGYRVFEAGSADDAMRQMGQQRPIHLVVTEDVIRGTSGRTLVERLRARCGRLHALYISDGTGVSAPLSSGEAVIRKPFVPSVLTRKVRQALDSQE